jgi:hypothetical protein
MRPTMIIPWIILAAAVLIGIGAAIQYASYHQDPLLQLSCSFRVQTACDVLQQQANLHMVVGGLVVVATVVGIGMLVWGIAELVGLAKRPAPPIQPVQGPFPPNMPLSQG